MRAGSEFTASVRRGRRAARSALVVHAARAADSAPQASPTRVGLVVGRAVGGSVTRHRVARRLRHQVAARLDRLPAGQLVVVRALPAAAACSSQRLGGQLDEAFERLFGPVG
jgi:ribonuclease P protein component